MPPSLKRLADLINDKDPIPNKLTIGIGKLVRQAREEADISQSNLSSMIYRRRATISNIENGKSELTLSTLVLISAALDKPITYFLPRYVYANLNKEDLEPAEQEILIQFRKIWSEDLQRLAVQQVKQIADLDIENFRKEQQEQVEDLDKSHPLDG